MAAAVAVAVAAPAAGSRDVEFIRARSDKREYRRVVLPNALEILLISDHDTDKVRPASRGRRERGAGNALLAG
jgi:insulysin